MNLAVAQLLTWPFVHSEFYLSFLQAQVNMPKYNLLVQRTGQITEMRNWVADAAYTHGHSHLLFIDCDMVYPPDLWPRLENLVKLGADIACGLCYRGAPPYDPLVWGPDLMGHVELLIPGRDYQWGDIIEAEAAGTGCMLINLEILTRFKAPWFVNHEEEIMPGVMKRTGEDVYFCRQAREAGAKLLVDTGLEVAHIRDWRIDRNMYLIWQKLHGGK